MAKSKKRIEAAKQRRERKEKWKTMTPEARKEWSEARVKTAKSGYAKRRRERDNGQPMASRSQEGVRKRFRTPHVSQPALDAWLSEFHGMTA
jgi:hypothetical protein